MAKCSRLRRIAAVPDCLLNRHVRHLRSCGQRRDSEHHHHHLFVVDHDVGKGELVAVIGRVGCGKTCLVGAMCGDLVLEGGSGCQQSGTISHAPGTPFIVADTIKNNVLLGEPYTEDLFESSIKCAQMEPEVATIGVSGSMYETMVADGGANLSGGQRRRLNLACATYRNGDIFLLDQYLRGRTTDVCPQA